MRPMQLKEPSPCCKSPTLVWNPKKGHYFCPCGEMRVNEFGRIIKKRGGMQPLKLGRRAKE